METEVTKSFLDLGLSRKALRLDYIRRRLLDLNSIEMSRNLNSHSLFRGDYNLLLPDDHEANNDGFDSRQNFGRQSNRANGTGNNSSQRGNSSSGPSPSSSSHALHQTTSFSSNMSSDEMQQAGDSQLDPEPTKFFFQETYARLGVKGNFLPLAAQPPNVDLGEWLAHHCK